MIQQHLLFGIQKLLHRPFIIILSYSTHGVLRWLNARQNAQSYTRWEGNSIRMKCMMFL